MGEDQWFHSIRTLRILVLVCFVVAAFSAAGSIYLTRQLAGNNETLTQVGMVRVESLSLYALGLQMCQATRNIILDPANPTAATNYQAAVAEFESTLRNVRQHADKLLSGSKANDSLAAIEQDFRAHIGVQNRIHGLAKEGRFDESKQLLNSGDTPLWRRYKQSILDYAKSMEEHGNAISATIRSGSAQAQVLSWICGLLVVGASFAAFAAAGRSSAILRELSGQLLTGANQIAQAAGQVASSSSSLAQAASQQAAALEETSASSEQINSNARRNSEHSRSAQELVVRSQDRLEETNRKLGETVAAMAEISDSSDKIRKVIKVIDEIAFQTNILALNAAVEAARAGEAGMGFGVVADEVRSLAQRCAQAAGDTSQLIEGSIAKSRVGKAKVDEVAVSIGAIVAESAKVKTLVEEVNLGSTQQAQGVEQTARVLAQMDAVTQRTAASAEEGAAAAEELNAQSETLREIVSRLAGVIGN